MLVTRGVLNLTHRASHSAPAPLEPGVVYHVTVPLKGICRVLVKVSFWNIFVVCFVLFCCFLALFWYLHLHFIFISLL